MSSDSRKLSSGKLTLWVVLCLLATILLLSMNSIAAALGFGELWDSLRPVAFVVVGVGLVFSVFRLASWLSRR